MPRRNIKRPCMWFFWITAAPKLQKDPVFRKFSAVFVVEPMCQRLSGFPPRRRPQDGLYLHWRNRSYSLPISSMARTRPKSFAKIALLQSCANVCAGGIDLPRLIRDIRARVSEEQGGGAQAALLASVMKNRKLFHTLLKFCQQGPASIYRWRTIPAAFAGHVSWQTWFQGLARCNNETRLFRDMWPEMQPRPQNPTMRIAIFGGCARISFILNNSRLPRKGNGAKCTPVIIPWNRPVAVLPVGNDGAAQNFC